MESKVDRKQIQEEIDALKTASPNMTFEELEVAISVWLDTKDLAYQGLTQEFVKERILDDLNSYEGVSV